MGPLPAAIGTLLNLRGLIIDDNNLSGDVTNLFNKQPSRSQVVSFGR
jgi:hypothetical protein